MRGKVSGELLDINQYGITPAYAGKRIFFDSRFRFVQDHPRLCGEKCFLLIKHMFVYGSPPPMRGKGSFLFPPKILHKDHPRLCGEKFRFLEISPAHEGSPPPMRGKERYFSRLILTNGITPAYAGKRKNARPFPGAAWDHPRLCGEKFPVTLKNIISTGSPPPMRGKGKKAKCSYSVYRITPAYAGKSLFGGM